MPGSRVLIKPNLGQVFWHGLSPVNPILPGSNARPFGLPQANSVRVPIIKLPVVIRNGGSRL